MQNIGMERSALKEGLLEEGLGCGRRSGQSLRACKLIQDGCGGKILARTTGKRLWRSGRCAGPRESNKWRAARGSNRAEC